MAAGEGGWRQLAVRVRMDREGRRPREKGGAAAPDEFFLVGLGFWEDLLRYRVVM